MANVILKSKVYVAMLANRYGELCEVDAKKGTSKAPIWAKQFVPKAMWEEFCAAAADELVARGFEVSKK